MNMHAEATYPSPPTHQLLTVDAVADRLAVSPATVYRLVASGRLAKLRIGGSTRFRAPDVERLIEESQAP